MPRPGPVRTFVGVRLSPQGLEAVQALANQEAKGNLSEMIRTLLAEAVAARQRKPRRSPA